MSLFGDSRVQTPDDLFVEEDEFNKLIDQSFVTRESSPDELPGKVPRPTEHPSEDEPEDDDQSVTDTHADPTYIRPSKKVISQYRRWYYHELNLLDAFETAAASDLAHNLLGLAMEKRAHLKLHEAQKSDDWTSMARKGDENVTESLRRSHAWAAWPCAVKDLSDEVTGFVAWEVDNAFDRASKKPKMRHAGEEIEEALFGVGLEAAREQTAKQRQPAITSEESMLPVTPESLTFSTDEELSVKLLKPAAREALDRVEHLFATLKPLKRPRKDKTGLLDWNDVLNSAESLGWNTNAIMTTVSRCSAMFSETRKPQSAHNDHRVWNQTAPMSADPMRPIRSWLGGNKDVLFKLVVDDAVTENPQCHQSPGYAKPKDRSVLHADHTQDEVSQVPVTALTQPWHDVVFAGQGAVFKVFDRASTQVIYSDAIFADQTIHGIVHHLVNSNALLLLVWGGRYVFFCQVSREQSNRSKTSYNLHVSHKSVIKISDWIFDVAFRPTEDRSAVHSWAAVAVTAHNEIFELCSRMEQNDPDRRNPAITSNKLFCGPKCGLYSATLQWLSIGRLLVVSGTAFGEIVLWSLSLRDTTVEAHRHHVFTGHEGSIFGVRVSGEISVANGTRVRLLASCSDDRTIRVWDVSDLQNGTVLNQRSTLDDERESSRTTGFLNYVSEEVAAESSKLCIATGMGHISRIWDIRFAFLRSLGTQDGYVCSVVSVGEDATCQTWHLNQISSTGNPISKLTHVASSNLHEGKNIWSISNVNDATQSCILTGGADGKIVEHLSLQQHVYMQDDHLNVSEWTIDETLEQLLLADAEDEQGPQHLDSHITSRKGKQDSFRSFAAIGTSQLLVTTNEGLVLLTTRTPAGQWTWKRLTQFDELRGYSVACHLVAELFEYVFFGDARGTIYYYHSFFETVKVLTKIEGKITKLMAEMLPSITHEYMSIVVTRQGGHPPVQLRINLGFGGSITLASTRVFAKWSPQFPQITSAVVATHDSFEKGLIIGCRNGSIHSYSNVESPGRREFDSELPLSHGKEAVTAMSWLPRLGHQNNMWNPSFGWLFSVGRDGTLAIHNWEGNYTDPVLVHRLSLSFGPNLEGLSIDSDTLDVSVWGFTSKYFVFQNVSALEDIVSVECGGAHRVWHFAPFDVSLDGMRSGLFAWIKAMRLNLASLNGPSHKVLQGGSHGREIKTCAVAPAIIHQGLGPLVATGAEDTNIAISYLADWHAGQAQLKQLAMLRKHVTGVQSLHWSSDGHFLFSCGGFEEFYVWRLRPVPGISIGVVCESKLPRETLDSELRVTDFSVCNVALREGNSLGDEHWIFLISMVYSDSSLKVWKYTSSDFTVPDRQAWSFVVSTQYTTACLTTAAYMSSNTTGWPLITGATDGHLALWSLSDAKRKLTCESLQVLHQSSIKALAKVELTNDLWLIASGGDDNALGLTILVYDDEAGTYKSSPLLVPSAHAAAINAVLILPSHASEHRQVPIELEVVTAGNDQTIRIWKVNIDPRQRGVGGLDVSRTAKKVSAVADISSLACFPRRHGSSERSNKLLVSGVGTEIWTIPSLTQL